jgi:diguanylate cyclase (GGDEF)-like protein
MSDFKSVPRTTDAVIILLISGGITIGLLPFSIIRILEGDTPVATLNTIALASTFLLFLHVFFTNKTHIARWGLAIMCVLVMTLTIHLKGHEQILWVFPALTTIFYLLTPHIAALISLVFMLGVMYMIWPDVSNMSMLRFVVSAGATFAFLYAFSARMRKQAVFLSRMATIDTLTGAGNRRALEEKLLDIATKLERYPEQSCSLIMFDLDHFKEVNDKHGHGCGDRVLQNFAKVVSERIRQSDSWYRFGGEEFVVILENTSLTEAMALALELSKGVNESKWHLKELNITVSAGIAQFTGKESTYDWLSRADKALYKAKSSGRNCCVPSGQQLGE